MKYEHDAMETAELQQLSDTQPPKLEREDASADTPPRLDRLGGYVMEASIEQRKAEYEQLRSQLGEGRLGGTAIDIMRQNAEFRLEQAKAELEAKRAEARGEEAPLHTPEYYMQKKQALQDEMHERQLEWTARRFDVNYGTPTTEQGWKDEAAQTLLRWGENTPYYHYCLEQAAKAKVEGR